MTMNGSKPPAWPSPAIRQVLGQLVRQYIGSNPLVTDQLLNRGVDSALTRLAEMGWVLVPTAVARVAVSQLARTEYQDTAAALADHLPTR